MKLRQYQSEAVDAVLERVGRGESPLIQMATGLGKTVVIGGVSSEVIRSGRILIIVHRQEILHQIAGTVGRMTGEKPGIEMADLRVNERSPVPPRVVVASVQSLVRRLNKFRPDAFDVIIIDEGHHAVASTYRRIFEHFAGVPRVAVTATMMRADGLGYHGVFSSVPINYDLRWGIQNGWLVPIRQQIVRADMDLSSVGRVAGDFNRRQLSHELERYEALHTMIHPAIDIAGDRQGIVFCASVNHARMAAQIINRHRKGSAVFVSGMHNQQNREKAIGAYRRGEAQFLCNVAVATEGFDAPGTGVVIMARPFLRPKSLPCSPTYAQCVGRVTRPLPGVTDGHATPDERRHAIAASDKPHGLVIDFTGTVGRHRLVTAADLDGRVSSGTARERVAERPDGAEVDVFDEIDATLAEEIARRREEHERRGDWLKFRSEYEREDVDPFRVNEPEPFRPKTPPRHTFMHPVSDKQKRYLIDLGVDPSTCRTRGHAIMAIEAALHDRKERRAAR